MVCKVPYILGFFGFLYNNHKLTEAYFKDTTFIMMSKMRKEKEPLCC